MLAVPGGDSHRMLANSQTRARIVGDKAFFHGHLLQEAAHQNLRAMLRCFAQQRSFQLSGALNLPERIAAVLDTIELVHGADLSQARQFFPIQCGTRKVRSSADRKGPSLLT